MDLKIKKDRLMLSFKYDPPTVARCHKTGVEMKWIKAGKYWWLPDNLVNRAVVAKEFTELDYHPDDMPIPNGLYYPPPEYMFKHQRDELIFSYTTPRWLFYHRTGTGKTILGLEIIRSKLFTGQVKKTLVICPLGIINTAWMDDLGKFAPEMKAINLWEHKHKKTKTFKEKLEWADIGIINFESFKTFKKHFKDQVQMVIIDESSKLKSGQAQITKQMIEFCDDIPFVYMFSGTPAPNTKMEYFTQARIVDPCIFGRSFYKFRNKYYYSAGFGGFSWYLKSEYEFEMMDKIASFSSVVRKRDIFDLPPRTFNIIDVHLNKEEKQAYKEMVDHLITIIEDEEITAYNAAAKCMKLRQVTAGFMINEDGVCIDFGNSKLKALLELLETIGDAQVIIWTQFIHESQIILDALEKKKKVARRMIGDTTQKNRDINIREFKAGDVQYLIAHPATMAHGFTLTNCTYAVYYSISYSHEEHLQSQDRIYRYGTTKSCSYYYLMAVGSIDKTIYSCLARKSEAEQMTLEHVKNAQAWSGKDSTNAILDHVKSVTF